VRSRRALIPSLLAAALVLSAAAYLGLPAPDVAFSEQVIASASGRPIRALFVLPARDKRPDRRSRPAIVAIPPYSIPPEAMEVICVEAAHRGAACAIPDFFGRSPRESRQNMGKDSLNVMTLDVLSILGALRRLPFVDPRRTGVCGHSVGGTVAVLAGMRDPYIRAVAPIGMVSAFDTDRPRNLLFISGLYDEIHSPLSLLQNLEQMGVTKDPQNGVLYGDINIGTARKVHIVPTTDHFIETFDPRLIKALLAWFGKALARPELEVGRLNQWSRKVSMFLFTISASLLYMVLFSRLAAAWTRKLAPIRPGWLILRLQALHLLVVAPALWGSAVVFEFMRPLAADLMIMILLAHEVVSHRSRGVLIYGPDRSPFRNLRAAGMVMLLLGASVLLTYAIVSVPAYMSFPGMTLHYPRFALNMAVLFPLEVWGRVKPWFFDRMIHTLDPSWSYFALLAVVVLVPGGIMRAVDRLAAEVVITVRTRLRPLHPRWQEGGQETDQDGGGANRLKAAVLLVLLALLSVLVYRRIAEGMLTPETAMLAGKTVLRFAVLPFVITALVLRTRRFRALSNLD